MAAEDFVYHETSEKMIKVFGDTFKNIRIREIDKCGQHTRAAVVPITFAPRGKALRVNQEDNRAGDKGTRVYTLPRMSFEFSPPYYDAKRHHPQTNKLNRQNPGTDQTVWRYWSVPFNWDVNLYIHVKHYNEGLQIIEQILPNFTPNYMVSVINLPVLDERVNIPILLNNVILTDTYDGQIDTYRTIEWTLSFTMQGHLYGPVNQSSLIKEVIVDLNNYGVPSVTNAVIDSVVVPRSAPPDGYYTKETTITEFIPGREHG
jgi:hypothetical protein